MDTKVLTGCKSRLLDLRKRLLGAVDSTEEALREDVVKPGEITNLPTHPADQDVEGLDAEVAISQNEELLFEQVDAALERITSGTYGTCSRCGRAIDLQRLQAIPYANDCMDCARGRPDTSEEPIAGEPRRFR